MRSPQRRGSVRPVGGSLDGWNIQRNVINALVYRELKHVSVRSNLCVGCVY